MPIGNFRDLDVWNVGMDLVLHIYSLASGLPPSERFEMGSQMRRAAVSVPSNVAEGHACGLRRRYRNHVRIAIGSVAELVTCVEIAARLGYITAAVRQQTIADLERMSRLLHGVLRSIRRQLRTDVRRAEDR